MTSVMDLMKVMIIAQLFFSFAITTVAYAIPAEDLNFVTTFQSGSSISLQNVGEQVEDSLTSQVDIPIIELGAMIFYSGNVLLDLLLNFVFALPEMIGMFLNGLFLLFHFDSFVWMQMQLFFSVLILTLYVIGLIQLITGIRSGRLV